MDLSKPNATQDPEVADPIQGQSQEAPWVQVSVTAGDMTKLDWYEGMTAKDALVAAKVELVKGQMANINGKAIDNLAMLLEPYTVINITSMVDNG